MELRHIIALAVLGLLIAVVSGTLFIYRKKTRRLGDL